MVPETSFQRIRLVKRTLGLLQKVIFCQLGAKIGLMFEFLQKVMRYASVKWGFE
jgi:hypothetical protein